jgi:uncharacterized small protein (DUF1192 family)
MDSLFYEFLHRKFELEERVVCLKHEISAIKADAAAVGAMLSAVVEALLFIRP